jgi:hypothetical protein
VQKTERSFSAVTAKHAAKVGAADKGRVDSVSTVNKHAVGGQTVNSRANNRANAASAVLIALNAARTASAELHVMITARAAMTALAQRL